MKKACITGITGQTGSYLAEILIEKGYEVHGLIRRSSSFSTGRIEHIYNDIKLAYGDLSDYGSISNWVREVQPDEFYNLGAMSHVRVSFDIPEYTMDIGATGVIRCLEALSNFSPHTHFVQASTSEMFGSVPPPQNEKTVLHPRSPYGAAKIAGFWSTVNYREAGKLFAANSMSFNHETVADFMPVIFKQNGIMDIKPISEVVCDHCNIGFDLSRDEYQEGEVKNDVDIWDANGWTRVKFASGYSHKHAGMNKNPRFVNARNSAYMATDTHVVIMCDGSEKEIKDISIGDKIGNVSTFPNSNIKNVKNIEEARLIGFIVGDGCVTSNHLKLTAKTKEKMAVYTDIWEKMGGNVRYQQTKSGFSDGDIWQANLTGKPEWVRSLDVYDSFGNKRIPVEILNSTNDIKHAFLLGYNDADGLKNNPCNYVFKNFKTNSATLAMGLLYLVSQTTSQQYNITVEESEKWEYKTLYYSINLLSDNPRCNARESVKKYVVVKPMLDNGKSILSIHKETGISYQFIHKVKHGYVPTSKSHLEKPQNEVKKIIEMNDFDGWFFDLETESGTFHCGIGCGHVHNSPRRGETFVTRKITRAATRIKLGLQDKLVLGNLDAQRDWNHAKDVARAIHLMATAPKADDWVVASGEMYSVKDFLVKVFDKLGLHWEEFVEFDSKYLRPTEVDALCGDPSKIKSELGWKPEYTFDQLVDEMVEHDLKLATQESKLKSL
jgi:GDP-D-mannose dehydratase